MVEIVSLRHLVTWMPENTITIMQVDPGIIGGVYRAYYAGQRMALRCAYNLGIYAFL
jgi:hypothetical protein